MEFVQGSFFRLKNDKGGFHYSLIKRMFLRVMFGFQLNDPERKKEKKKNVALCQFQKLDFKY